MAITQKKPLDLVKTATDIYNEAPLGGIANNGADLLLGRGVKPLGPSAGSGGALPQPFTPQRPSWMTDAQWAAVNGAPVSEAQATQLNSERLGGLTAPASTQILPGGKENFAAIGNMAGLQSPAGGPLVNAFGKTVAEGATPLPTSLPGTTTTTTTTAGGGGGDQPKPQPQPQPQPQPEPKKPVVTNTGVPTATNPFTTPAYKPTLTSFTPLAYRTPADLQAALKPLTPEEQAQLASTLANLQVDPQVQELMRQRDAGLLSDQQAIGNLFGAAFQRAQRNLTDQMQQARERQVGVTNAGGKLFSPLGRGEVAQAEQPYANAIGDINFQATQQAQDVAQRFEQRNQQLSQQIADLESRRGQLNAAERLQLQQAQQEFAANRDQALSARNIAEQGLGLQAAAFNQGGQFDMAKFLEGARQFGLDFGQRQTAQDTLLPLQAQGLGLQNAQANQNLYQQTQAFQQFGLQPQQLAIEQQQLQNEAARLQNTLARETNPMQRQLLEAQIANLYSQAAQRGQTTSAESALTPQQQGAALQDANGKIVSILGNANLNEAQKRSAIQGILGTASMQIGLPIGQIAATLGVPQEANIPAGSGIPGLPQGGGTIGSVPGYYGGGASPQLTPSQAVGVQMDIGGKVNNILSQIKAGAPLADALPSLRLAQMTYETAMGAGAFQRDFPEAAQYLTGGGTAPTSGALTPGAQASMTREAQATVNRLSPRIDQLEAYLANPTPQGLLQLGYGYTGGYAPSEPQLRDELARLKQQRDEAAASLTGNK